MFADRDDAGRQLATELRDRGVNGDLVLAIPRGGLPIGRAVADVMDVPLDVVAARKIRAPGNPELALGAVASEGTRWINERLVRRLNVDADYIERESHREHEAAREKVERYRHGRALLELADKRVVLVDDGIATGATAIACLRQLRGAACATVILGAPVAAAETIERLQSEADEVVVVRSPRDFGAVGRFYRSFPQVTDDEATAYLDTGRADPGQH